MGCCLAGGRYGIGAGGCSSVVDGKGGSGIVVGASVCRQGIGAPW